MKWAATSVRQTASPVRNMAQPNCNDQIAANAFGCQFHFPPTDFDSLSAHDAIFVTMSKIREPFEPRWMDMAHRLCDAGKRVVLFQEAETGWALTRSWEEQKSFIELLGKVDLFLTHNQRDVELWGRLTRGGRSAFRWRTCLDLERIRPFRQDPSRKTGRPILFGSSYDDRANGLTGLVACKDYPNPLWHQNRSTGYEDRNRELPYLLGCRMDKEIPHSNWDSWLDAISGAYIAVHPMPAAAAGRDQIAFAMLGIPCVGSWELDLQRELFPEREVEDIYNPMTIRSQVDILLNPCVEDYEWIRQNAIAKVESLCGLPQADIQAQLLKNMMGWS